MTPFQLSLFNSYVTRVQDHGLRAACYQLRQYPKFHEWPAAIKFHHAYEGGLLEHTLEVTEYALCIAKAFPFAKVDRDVLITAALWHDWGKTLEYQIEDWTSNGKDIPHLIRNKDATGFNVWTRDHEATTHLATSAIEFSKHCDNPAVVHCILSHHGRKDWGAIEEPRTVEALILHQADMLSAKYGATK